MVDLPREYRYQYRMWGQFGSWHHSYEVIGRHGAMHLHITDMGEKRANEHGLERYSAGLETHWRVPPDYMRNDAPSHNKCWLIEAPCWHDGTSLYAREQFLPMFNGVDHDLMFRMLAGEMKERWPLKQSEDTP